MCQPVAIAVLLGSLLLLLSAEETAAAKFKPFHVDQCREVVMRFRLTHCFRGQMTADQPPADANAENDRKRRDTEAVLQTDGSTEDPTKKSKESPKWADKFPSSYKRNPLQRSSSKKFKKVAQKRTEDLLGFNASKEELADIYNSSAPREPRNLRSHCIKGKKVINEIMKMFHNCCDDFEECFKRDPHIKECYNHYKNSCR